MKNKHLLCDIGNTSFDFCFLDGKDSIYKKFRSDEEDKISLFIKEIHSEDLFCLISSVNHKNLSFLLKILEENKIKNLVLSPALMKEYAIKHGYIISNTEYLGGDLYCDVIATKSSPSIIIDLGTVGKILFLDKNNLFRGAAIFPDIQQFPAIMDTSTDLLKGYGLKMRPPLVSLKTEECISSGAINGMCGLISGYISQLKKEYRLNEANIILTGGASFYIAETLKQYVKEEFKCIPYLCLDGLKKILDYITKSEDKNI